MELRKRDCGIKMRLVPYGAGWTDVYADFGDGELYFIISNTWGRKGFQTTMMRALYYLYPDPGRWDNSEDETGSIVYKDAVYQRRGLLSAPWKASFSWDEECSGSHWSFEREPNFDTSFDLHVHIEIRRSEVKEYDYTVRYEDMCYEVADACTKALKKHGFWGYHQATYTEDVNVRYLLFLKSVALRNFEARQLTCYDEKGKGETSNFSKEMELLLFDM